MNEFYNRLQKAINTSSWVNLVKRDDARLLKVEPAVYVANFANVTLSTTTASTADILFQSDSDFAVLFGTFNGFTAATGVTDATMISQTAVNLVDRNSNQSFYNTATLISCVFGGAQYPAIWPVPRVFKASTRLTFQWYTLGAAYAGVSAQFALIGAKLFYR